MAKSLKYKLDTRCFVEDGDKGWIFPFGAKFNSKTKSCESGNDHYGVGVYEESSSEYSVVIIDS